MDARTRRSRVESMFRRLPDKFCVFDLEYTTWEGSLERNWSEPHERKEIIQIGAVALNRGLGLSESRHLSVLVLPTINPRLSDYCERLTGITQGELDRRGIAFPDALDELVSFAGSDLPLCCCGTDADVIEENCEIYGLAFPFRGEDLMNLRPRIAVAFSEPESAIVSSELPELIGDAPAGRAHDALDDARSIAAFLRALDAAADIQVS